MKPRLRKFIIHNFVAYLQEEQYKICLNTFPKTFVMSIVDFEKNYNFEEYNEVQEMH